MNHLLTDQFKILENKASDYFYNWIINPFTQLICSKTKELTVFNVIILIIHKMLVPKHWFITAMRCMGVHKRVLWICQELFMIVRQTYSGTPLTLVNNINKHELRMNNTSTAFIHFS